MRVVGYIENPTIKITLFHQGLRYTLKFEDGLYEQSFKFRESDELNTLEAFQNLVDEPFIKEVEERFNSMRHSAGALMGRFCQTIDEEYEDQEVII